MTNTTTTKTAIYLRQSLDRTKDEAAIDRQRTACHELAGRRGLTNLIEYTDNDISASNPRKIRPAYQQLLKDMDSGHVGSVIVWNLDRLHRGPIELEGFIEIADRRKIALASASGDVDLATPQGRWFAGMMANNARLEVEQKGQRQRLAATQMASRGVPKWRTAFGYSTDGSHEPHPIEAPLVAAAYAAVLSGASLSGIAREWNDAGHVGRTGKPWTASTMSLFLRSARNAGLRSHNDVLVLDDAGQPVKGNWPAIVDPATWQAAQQLLDDPARKPGPRTVKQHYLTGILQCGKCADGGRMGGYQGPKGQERYRCWKCLGIAISKPHTEDFIRRLVCERLSRADARELLVDRDAPDLDKLAGEANALNARGVALATMFADGDLSRAELKAARDKITINLEAVAAAMMSASAARVFDGLPLGTDQVHVVFNALEVDRQRAIINVILTATILPVGKGHRPAIGVDGVRFDSDRIRIDWR